MGASSSQEGPPSRSINMIRIREYLTSSAVSGVPSLNFTPWRILKVYVFPSLLTPPFATLGTAVASIGS